MFKNNASHSVMQDTFTLLLKSLLLTFSPLSIHSPTSISLKAWRPLTVFLCVLPFPECPSWSHTVHSLFRSTSLRGIHLRLALSFHIYIFFLSLAHFLFIHPSPLLVLHLFFFFCSHSGNKVFSVVQAGLEYTVLFLPQLLECMHIPICLAFSLFFFSLLFMYAIVLFL